MINQHGGMSRELILVAGLSPADIALVHREALRVLRTDIDAAHLDAYSDDPWPPAVLRSYERVLCLAREAVAAGTRAQRADPGMGIDIDVRDDAQFELMLDLVPHTINAEGWREGQLVFGTSDSGTSLWMVLTQEQEAELLSRLAAQGIPSTALAVQPPGR
ncbi:hypothetical protein ACFFSH_34340 [Streptomyces filamentosus]|uniref:Uncharacterized protein n=1 Tax=Streptomyces filamentosus TaxID=67294 RepID=A0A919BPW8_STRFL|nr:hypothetical protein [Streptomyces filamentosus]GHG04706.1 hypothetical protein GCM10017667_39080 [Streptomyces filamentosus]